MPNLSQSILQLECFTCILFFSIISFIIDLFDIFKNGLSLNNNRNKLYIFIIIFVGGILVFEGYKKFNGFNHCIPIFGLLLIVCSLSDLLYVTIMDISHEFDYITLIKLIGYLIIPVVLVIYFIVLTCNN